MFSHKASILLRSLDVLSHLSITPTEAQKAGFEINKDGRKRSALDLLAYPDITLDRLAGVWPEIRSIPWDLWGQLETDGRYAAYVKRQEVDVEALKRDEANVIPADFEYDSLPSLKAELRQKLSAARPHTIAQAARIEGMTPAALMLLLASIKKQARAERGAGRRGRGPEAQVS